MGDVEFLVFKVFILERLLLKFVICVVFDELVGLELCGKILNVFVLLGLSVVDCVVLVDFVGVELFDLMIVVLIIGGVLEIF